MSLEKIQHDFIHAFFGNQLKNAATHVKNSEALSAEQRIGIYRGSVHGILTQALEQTFPVTKMLVGDSFFNPMCDVFIDKHPPSSPFFADFGSELANFLDQFEPAQAILYLADMARLEWLRKESWNTKETKPSDFSKLIEIPESDHSSLIFNLNPSLQLFSSDYRIDTLWEAHQFDQQAKIDVALEQLEDINQAIKLAIWKTNEQLAFFNLDETLWEFLQAILNQSSLQTLALRFDTDLPKLLSQSIQHGWLQSYAQKKTAPN